MTATTAAPPWAPTCGTPATPARPTTGRRVAALAAMLGQPLDPWQSHVANVAGELDGDGLPAYRTVVLVVPRQQGKTWLTLPLMTERLMRAAPQAVGYGAQTGFDARNKLLDDHVPVLEESPLGPHLRVRRSAGNTAVMLGRSALRVLNTGRRAARGQSLDLVVFDEGFALTRDTYAGVSATTITRSHHQLWVVSNAGDEDAVVLAELVGLGRTFVGEGRRDTVALFEWAAPRDADRDDPAVWAAAMPAVAAGRVPLDTIASRHAEDTSPKRSVFAREYLNVWPTDLADRVIPADPWDACQDPEAAPHRGLVLAVEVTFDRDAAAVVAADDRGHLEVIDHRPGVDWVPDRVADLTARHGPSATVVDPGGPASPLIPSLQAAGVPVTADANLRTLTDACQMFRDHVIAATLAVRPSDALDAAVVGAARRTVGARWAFERAGRDATTLVAAALAHHRATTGPAVGAW